MRNQQADQFLLTTYEELAIDQCKGCPVVTPLEYYGACKRSEASGIRVNEIQLRVAVARQQEIVNQNGVGPHERRLTVGLPLDLAVHAHRHESVGSRIGRELGVEVVLVDQVDAAEHAAAFGALLLTTPAHAHFTMTFSGASGQPCLAACAKGSVPNFLQSSIRKFIFCNCDIFERKILSRILFNLLTF